MKNNYIIGGENSGHLIQLDYLPTLVVTTSIPFYLKQSIIPRLLIIVKTTLLLVNLLFSFK